MPEIHPLSVLNPKALDRQVKVLEKRIHELRSELDELERMKLACRILMGEEAAAALAAEPVPTPAVSEAARVARPKSRPKRAEESEVAVADEASSEDDVTVVPAELKAAEAVTESASA